MPSKPITITFRLAKCLYSSDAPHRNSPGENLEDLKRGDGRTPCGRGIGPPGKRSIIQLLDGYRFPCRGLLQPRFILKCENFRVA